MAYIINKIQCKFWHKLVQYSKDTKLYIYIYCSYWHYLLYKQQGRINNTCYYTAIPNPGAGVGHQLANWIAGYWFAKQFGLKFAHIPFSTLKWEDFLGFGEDEVTVKALMKQQGYKKVMLPLFNESNTDEVIRIKKIIDSYSNKKVIFIAEQDQFYRDQYGVMEDIKRKFYQAKARCNDKLIYSSDSFNIAIHIRRGDIVIGQANKNSNLQMRWQNNDYFENVLSNVLQNISGVKPTAIYIFSQGKRENFTEFEQFANVHYCLDMNPQDSFLHMVYADLLITSKSSFSYKPALLNNGIKICPRNFWHGYPTTNDWILAEENGSFATTQLNIV
jgi:hypothetical protein